MIDVIGYVKIDESKADRIKYLIACIRSYKFLAGLKSSDGRHPVQFILALQTPTDQLFSIVNNEVEKLKIGNSIVVQIRSNDESYGSVYHTLIELYGANKFVLNFMEDQFMVMDSKNDFILLIKEMEKWQADVCKASFYDIEEKCRKHILSSEENLATPYVFDNTNAFHMAFQEPYTRRYWLGVNFITTTKFALKFWNRPKIKSVKPHDYEIEGFHPSMEHVLMFPRNEVQAAIDDDHDEANSCLIKRNNIKFDRIIKDINNQYTVVAGKITPNEGFVGALGAAGELMPLRLESNPRITNYAMKIMEFIMGSMCVKNMRKTNSKLTVFEFGMGGSTVYFANSPYVKFLISIENNQQWYDNVTANIESAVACFFGIYSRPYNNRIDEYADESIDVILVDGVDRILCIESSIKKLKPGGILILNNSEQEEYKEAYRIMEDWHFMDCYQHDSEGATIGYEGWTTTIFEKPV